MQCVDAGYALCAAHLADGPYTFAFASPLKDFGCQHRYGLRTMPVPGHGVCNAV